MAVFFAGVQSLIFHRCSVVSEILGFLLESGCKFISSLHHKMTIEKE